MWLLGGVFAQRGGNDKGLAPQSIVYVTMCVVKRRRRRRRQTDTHRDMIMKWRHIHCGIGLYNIQGLVFLVRVNSIWLVLRSKGWLLVVGSGGAFWVSETEVTRVVTVDVSVVCAEISLCSLGIV